MTVKAPQTATQAVTANRLTDGAVVFFAAERGWSDRLAAAAIATSTEAGQRLLAAAEADVRACKVVEPYLIDVRTDDGRIEPLRYRERIRVLGPSIQPGSGRPADGQAGIVAPLRSAPAGPASAGGPLKGAALSYAY